MTDCTLSDVLLDIEVGKSIRTLERPARAGELGVLKLSAVTWMEFRPSEAKAVTGHFPAEHHKVQAGDLLITRANTKNLVGAVVLVSQDYPNRLLSDKTLRLVTDQSKVDKTYLLYALRSSKARRHIEDNATGSSDSMRNITQETVRATPIYLPSLPEQRRIAASLQIQLTAVGEAREAAGKMRSETEALRLAVYREAFSGIVPVGLDPNLDPAPRSWQWVKLTDVARLESGHTPSRARPDWWGGDVSWISLTEIRSLDGTWVEETRIRTNSAGIANSAARILPQGTVCLSRTASVGYAAIMAVPMSTSQDFANWVCGDDLDPEFLMHALIRSRNELRALATGATHKTIYMPTLGALNICLPSRSEQVRIVQRLHRKLDAVTTLQASAKEHLRLLDQLPSQFLAKAFGDS